MRPVLFSLFSLKITSYSLFLVVAFIVGTIWAGFRAKKNGLNPDILPDVIFWVFFSSLAGAKLFGIIDALFNEIKIISLDMNYFLHLLLDSGIIAYGGIIGGSIAAIIYFKKKKKDLLPYANTVAPGLGLGVFLIRIGCFLSGCCWGKTSTSFCAVSFPPYTGAGMYQMRNNIEALFPSQLLASFNGLIIVLLILFTEKIINSTSYSFYLFITLYSISRFIVDFTRYYKEGEMILHLSYNQWFCILFFIIGITAIIRQVKSSKMKKLSTVRA